MKNNIKKNFIWNSIGATINSASSLFFLIIVTRINGVDKAGVFTFAFSIACLLYIAGLYSGRTYQVTEPKKEITDSDYIYTRIITSSMILLFAIIYCLIKGYSFNKSSIVFILVVFKAIESMFDVMYGIFQKREDLYKVGISLFLKAIIQVTTFIIIDIITHDIFLASLGLIISNLLVFIFYDLRQFKKYNFKFSRFNFNHVKYILKFGFWTFLFTFLTQYLINAPKYSIDNLLTDDVQTIYGIISMPATLILLSSTFLIQPFLNILSSSIEKKDYKKFNGTIIKLVVALIGIGIVALVFAYFVGIPFLEIIYSLKLGEYLTPLLLIITGAVLYGITTILSSGLITIRKTFIQSIIFIVMSIIAFFLSNYFVKENGIIGASYSYLISMIILLIMYIVVYVIQLNKLKNSVNKKKQR